MLIKLNKLKSKIWNFLIILGVLTVSLSLGVKTISAHVGVKPNQVGVAAFQTFTVGVPVEKDMATVAVRLVIPEGVEHVSPNVKPGWTVTTKQSDVPEGISDGDEHGEGPVTEILWTGGVIPKGQRDDFLFSAKVPGEETTLKWKAYQTYADGSVIAWDLDKSQQPKDSEGKDDYSKSGPYSETKIVNDLKSPVPQPQEQAPVKGDNNLPVGISLLALVLSGVSLWKVYKK